MSNKKSNFTEGPMFWRINTFALPIILTGLLQIFYSMADNVVVGRFSSDPNALSAVGSTITVVSFIVNFLTGISLGAGVVVAQAFGAADEKMTSRAVHTAVGVSAVFGVAFGLLGFLLARPVLVMLGTHAEFLDSAVLYLRIICIGIPAQMIYNFGAGIQRSAGNSGISLYILGSTGIINVLLNLLFVIAFDMSVDGVALATVISNVVSAILIIISLMRRRDCCRLYLRRIRIEFSILKRILRLGLPSGIQSGVFAAANMVMTGAINQLPPENVHAFTVVSNVDGITSTIMNSYAQAAGTFAAQNFGARKYKRLVRSYLYGLFWSAGSAIVFGQLSLVFSKPLVGLFMDSTNPLRDQIFAAAIPMMQVMLNTLFLCGIMNVGTGVLRSIGYSMTSMIGCIICVVGGRLAWLYIFFPMEKFHTGAGAMVSFPAAWLLASVVITSTLFFCFGRVKRKFNSKVSAPSNN